MTAVNHCHGFEKLTLHSHEVHMNRAVRPPIQAKDRRQTLPCVFWLTKLCGKDSIIRVLSSAEDITKEI